MASEEHSAPAREKRQPVADTEGEALDPSNQLHPMEPWTKSSGSSSDSSCMDGLHSSSCWPFPSTQSTFTEIPQNQEAPSLRPVRRFIPPSWKAFFQRQRRTPLAEPYLLTYSPEDITVSPPVSPLLEHSRRTTFDVEGTSSDEGEGDFKKPPSNSTGPSKCRKTLTPTSHGDLSTGPPSYKEKLEAYNHKYSYMKSWPGLLRLMGGLELIMGGMVFACTAAYIQKDYQWSQLYGGNLPSSGIFGGGYSYNYYGPMTPFVLVVTSLVWLVTVILLGLGVTMYYRTILLDSHWWPLTEFALNLIMFLLYMAAAIAYVNDVNRGGLCYSLFANNPLVRALCRVEGGQVAAIAFLFVTMLLYLVGSLFCLKMWRHEAARKFMADLQKPTFLRVEPEEVLSQKETRPPGKVTRRVEFSEKGEDLEMLNYSIPMGHNPKPHVVPDYIVKYPTIRSLDAREKYKAVFQDQYAEYKELYCDVQLALQKFKELENLMSKLPRHYENKKEQSRISTVRKEYMSKKKDPTFLEKQQRCEYLKRKLTHIKGQIQAYDKQETIKNEGAVFF